MHTGKELKVQKGRLSCDSDAPQAGSFRSDWTRFVKVNRRKTNRRKTRLYCISVFPYRYHGTNAPYSFSSTTCSYHKGTRA